MKPPVLHKLLPERSTHDHFLRQSLLGLMIAYVVLEPVTKIRVLFKDIYKIITHFILVTLHRVANFDGFPPSSGRQS